MKYTTDERFLILCNARKVKSGMKGTGKYYEIAKTIGISEFADMLTGMSREQVIHIYNIRADNPNIFTNCIGESLYYFCE